MSLRHRRFATLAVAVLAAASVALSGCSGTDTADPDDADATTGTTVDPAVDDFCVDFPTRDATVILRAGEDPSLEGNPELAKQMLAIAADGVSNGVPAAIAPAVTVYVAALRGYQPGVDPLADPDTRAAVDDINAWLGQHCGPPTGSIPSTEAPATSPP